MTKSESSKDSVNGSTDGDPANAGYTLPTTIGAVNHDLTRHKAPAYSFGVRIEEKTRPSPGPQYKVGSWNSKGSGYSPSFSITGRPKRSVFDTGPPDSGPGPSAYGSESSPHRGPSYSFGLPFHHRGAPKKWPGPNSYSLPTTLGSRVPHMRGGPAVMLHGKGSDSKGFAFDNAKTPGPAGYGPVETGSYSRRAPAATLKGRHNLPPLKFVTPGPGKYDLNRGEVAVNKSSPRFSMGVRHGENVKPLFTLADVSE